MIKVKECQVVFDGDDEEIATDLVVAISVMRDKRHDAYTVAMATMSKVLLENRKIKYRRDKQNDRYKSNP